MSGKRRCEVRSGITCLDAQGREWHARVTGWPTLGGTATADLRAPRLPSQRSAISNRYVASTWRLVTGAVQGLRTSREAGRRVPYRRVRVGVPSWQSPRRAQARLPGTAFARRDARRRHQARRPPSPLTTTDPPDVRGDDQGKARWPARRDPLKISAQYGRVRIGLVGHGVVLGAG